MSIAKYLFKGSRLFIVLIAIPHMGCKSEKSDERYKQNLNEARALISQGKPKLALESVTAGFKRAKLEQQHASASDLAVMGHYIEWSSDHPNKALQWAQRALVTAIDGQDPSKELRALISALASLSDLGANAQLDQALARAKELCQRNCDSRGWIAFYEGNLAFHRGQWTRAITHLRRAAKELKTNTFAAKANVISARLRAHAEDADPAQLKLALQEFSALDKMIPEKPKQTPDQHRRAELELMRLRLAWVLRDPLFAKDAASRLAALQSDQDRKWETQAILGQFEELAGRMDQAQARYRAAYRRVMQLPAPKHSRQLSHWQVAARRQPYELLIRLLLKTSQNDLAFSTSESEKSRRFFAKRKVKHCTPSRMQTSGECSMSASASINPDPAPYVSFVQTKGRYFRFLLQENQAIEVKDLGESKQIDRKIRQLLASLDTSQFKVHANELGTLLFSGVPEGQKAAPSLLRVSPDAGLSKVPWPALRRNGAYLAWNYNLELIPSRQAQAVQVLQGEGRTAIVDSKNNLPSTSTATWLERFDQRYAGNSSTQAVWQNARFSEVLHVALHNFVWPISRLELADGDVTTDTIQSWKRAPKLSVIAGCGTANSTVPNIWSSWIGGFLRAGSKKVIGALWSLEDESARDFFGTFYQHLDHTSPTQALAQTQRDYIASGISPSVWGAMILGSMYTPSNSPSPKILAKKSIHDVRRSR